jgi:hypothetical protein
MSTRFPLFLQFFYSFSSTNLLCVARYLPSHFLVQDPSVLYPEDDMLRLSLAVAGTVEIMA